MVVCCLKSTTQQPIDTQALSKEGPHLFWKIARQVSEFKKELEDSTSDWAHQSKL